MWKGRWEQITKGLVVSGITDSMDLNLSKLQELVMDRKAWCVVAHEVTKSRSVAQPQI